MLFKPNAKEEKPEEGNRSGVLGMSSMLLKATESNHKVLRWRNHPDAKAILRILSVCGGECFQLWVPDTFKAPWRQAAWERYAECGVATAVKDEGEDASRWINWMTDNVIHYHSVLQRVETGVIASSSVLRAIGFSFWFYSKHTK